MNLYIIRISNLAAIERIAKQLIILYPGGGYNYTEGEEAKPRHIPEPVPVRIHTVPVATNGLS